MLRSARARVALTSPIGLRFSASSVLSATDSSGTAHPRADGRVLDEAFEAPGRDR